MKCSSTGLIRAGRARKPVGRSHFHLMKYLWECALKNSSSYLLGWLTPLCRHGSKRGLASLFSLSERKTNLTTQWVDCGSKTLPLFEFKQGSEFKCLKVVVSWVFSVEQHWFHNEESLFIFVLFISREILGWAAAVILRGKISVYMRW